MNYWHSLVLDAERSRGLCSLGNLQGVIAVEGGDLQRRSKCCLRKRNRHRAIQVFAFTFEEGVFLYVEDDVEISGWTTVRAGFALSAEANARAVFDARGHFDFNLAIAKRCPLPLALWAWIGHDGARSMARWTRSRDRKESLLITHLPAARATLACDWSFAGSGTRAIAGFTCFMATKLNFSGHTEGRFVELKGEVFTEVGSALRTSAASAPTKNVGAEEAAEQIAQVEILEDGRIDSSTKPAACTAYSSVPELVIALAFVLIHEDGIGFAAFLELLFGIRVIGIAVRMVLQREFAVRALDLAIARRAGDAEYFVIVTFGISGQSGPLLLFRFYL